MWFSRARSSIRSTTDVNSVRMGSRFHRTAISSCVRREASCARWVRRASSYRPCAIVKRSMAASRSIMDTTMEQATAQHARTKSGASARALRCAIGERHRVKPKRSSATLPSASRWPIAHRHAEVDGFAGTPFRPLIGRGRSLAVVLGGQLVLREHDVGK